MEVADLTEAADREAGAAGDTVVVGISGGWLVAGSYVF